MVASTTEMLHYIGVYLRIMYQSQVENVLEKKQILWKTNASDHMVGMVEQSLADNFPSKHNTSTHCLIIVGPVS